MGQWTCKSETMSELGDEISRERAWSKKSEERKI